MIPRTIHQIWIGDKELPQKWMSTVAEKCNGNDGWRYLLWDEEVIERFLFDYRYPRLEQMYREYYEKKEWHGCSDIVRVLALLKYGGVYIDADTEMLEPIHDEDFMQGRFFAVEANPRPGHEGRIANGIIGSVAGHELLHEYARKMSEAKVIRPIWSTIGGTMFTECILEYQNGGGTGIMILPPKSFYPESSRGEKAKGESKTYGRHYWGTTKKLY